MALCPSHLPHQTSMRCLIVLRSGPQAKTTAQEQGHKSSVFLLPPVKKIGRPSGIGTEFSSTRYHQADFCYVFLRFPPLIVIGGRICKLGTINSENIAPPPRRKS
jgi:hypothetical protein